MRFAIWTIIALVLQVSAAAAAGEASAVGLAETGYFQEIVPVDKGVWVLAEPKFQVQPIGNVTVIEQADGLVLVDAGGSPGAGRRIVGMVRSLSTKPVKAVIITQRHGDKPQGLSEILKAWPDARTISTLQTQAHLRDPATMNSPASPDPARNADLQKQLQEIADAMGQDAANAKAEDVRRGYARTERMLRQYKLDTDGALTIAPKEGFARSLSIYDPHRPVCVQFLGRANTDGDAVVWLPRQRILIAGEIVIFPFPYGFESYPAEWIRTLDALQAFDFKLLVPGHGMPQAGRAQIGKIRAALEDVRAQVGALASQGLTLDQVQAKANLDKVAESFIGGDPWLRIWFDAFFARPVVASAYHEAKGEPIVQNLKG